MVIASIYPVAATRNKIVPNTIITYLHIRYKQTFGDFGNKLGLLHEARKLRATALVDVSGIATSAPSTAYAVPLPRVARGRLGLWYLSFPRQSGGSGEHSEPIGAFVQQLLFVFFRWRSYGKEEKDDVRLSELRLRQYAMDGQMSGLRCMEYDGGGGRCSASGGAARHRLLR